MTTDFDPTPYVRSPLLDVPSGVALGVALLTAAPHGASEHVRKAARNLRRCTVALQSAWAVVHAQAPLKDRRKADMRIDNAWVILLDRLVAYSQLPAETNPRAVRAAELVTALSPDGRGWLNLNYGAEWAESERRIKKLDAESLAHDIDALAGPEFLAEVRSAHAAYGEALGVTEATAADPDVTLAEPLKALSAAVARYGLAVASTVDEEHASLVAARNALKPIDEYRAAQGHRATAAAPATPAPAPATPTTPVPEVH